MKKKKEFPKRVVLAEGHPWAHGLGKADDPYSAVSVRDTPVGGQDQVVQWPKELWDRNVPKYRLVLERVR